MAAGLAQAWFAAWSRSRRRRTGATRCDSLLLVRERAPWYRRRLGGLGRVAVALVVAAAAVGFLGPGDGAWSVLQVGLVVAAAVAYLVALVRSPD